MKPLALAAILALALPCAALAQQGQLRRDLEIPAGQGVLRAELVHAKTRVEGGPVAVILPGSGPTDRNGNSVMGVRTDAYRLLSEGLAAEGITTLRPDKRGMFSSSSASPNPNRVFVDDLAADARAWAAEARKATGASCAWLIGHSEGAIVALIAVQQDKDICGVILLAGPGRPLGLILREQLKANPANGPYLEQAFAALTDLEAGRHPDVSTMPVGFIALLGPHVQDYLINLLAKDPRKLAGGNKGPILILQGTTDIQVSVDDARTLKDAQPAAKLVLIEGMNHVLKVSSADRTANIATYSDPNLPLAPELVPAIAGFIKAQPGTN